MSLRSFLFGDPYNKELLTLQNFEEHYTISTAVNTFIADTDDFYTHHLEQQYHVHQEVSKREIINTVSLKSAVFKTDFEELNQQLSLLRALNNISTTYQIGRLLHGEIVEIRNQAKLNEDWKQAKEKLLPTLFKNEKERIGFTAGYEKGLSSMHKVLTNNWHYLLMLPDCYHFNDYVHVGRLSATAQHCYISKIFPRLSVKYRMQGVAYKKIGDKFILKLRSRVESNEDTVTHNATHKEYDVGINADYEIDRKTGKVLQANVAISETLSGKVVHQTAISLATDESLG